MFIYFNFCGNWQKYFITTKLFTELKKITHAQDEHARSIVDKIRRLDFLISFIGSISIFILAGLALKRC